MNGDLKGKIKSNVKGESEVAISDTNTIDDTKNNKAFIIGKKPRDTVKRKPFPLYLDTNMKKELDSIANKTNYSKNELIIKMIEFCIDNLKFANKDD